MFHQETPFFLVAENSPDAIYICSHGAFAYLNPAALKLLGAASADQLLGTPILDRIHPENRARAVECMEKLRRDKECFSLLEDIYIRLDGMPVDVEVSAIPFSYDGKESCLVFVRDVSEKKRQDRALKALNRDFVTLLENTSDFIYFKDRDSRFRFCSQTLARITGHRDWRDMIGKHDLEVFPPDTAKVYFEEEIPIFRDGKPLLGRIDPYYDEEGKPGWVNTSKWPVFSEDGKSVVGIFGISRIVTGRVRAEAEQERLNRTLQLLNDLNTAVLHADQEKTLLADVCRLIVERGGYRMAWVGRRQQDAGKKVRPLARAGDDTGYLDRIRVTWADDESGGNPAGASVRTGETRIDQNVAAGADRAPWREAATERGYRSIIGLPLRVGGAIFGTLVIYAAESEAFGSEEVGLMEKLAHNLAFGIERLRDKIKLDAINKELQAFTYAASHDLKGPLGRINSFSSLLERDYRDSLSGVGLQYLDFIRQNATRLSNLVDDLLAHAQVEQKPLSLQTIDLKAAVESALLEQNSQIQQSGARIRLNMQAAQVKADPYNISQVLTNLLDNALKYSANADPPIIDIGGDRIGEHYLFWVRDNGIGLDMAYSRQIFEIFRRLHTYSEYPGSGIGLALVKKAVERMGGSVWVESEPGRGAVFYLKLRAGG